MKATETEHAFTAEEIEFINGCMIDGDGTVVKCEGERPESMFDVFEDDGTVIVEYRSMFPCTADQAPKEAKGRALVDVDKIASMCRVNVEDVAAVAQRCNQTATKGVDEISLIDIVSDLANRIGDSTYSDTVTAATTKGVRKAWRKGLAEVVAGAFGVTARVDKDCTEFSGNQFACAKAVVSFEYLFVIGNRRAQRTYDDALAAHGQTKGIYAASANAFLAACKEKLAK